MKRIAAAGAAAVLSVLASGCGAVPDANVAARVGDAETSFDDVEAVLDAVVAEEGSTVQTDPATGTVDGQLARNVLSAFVTRDATAAFLSANGEAITDEDRQTFLDSVPEGTPALAYPADVLALLVDINAGQAARQRVVGDAAELQAQYEADPADLGVVCVRHILVATEAEAQDVLDELDGGTAFGELVSRSTDQQSALNGGALTDDQGQPCFTAGNARQTFVAPFAEAAVTAVPGTPVGPVQTEFGWHVIEARPFEDVADSLAVTVADAMFEEYLDDLDVQVDPRYGRWDAATGQVVELRAQ